MTPPILPVVVGVDDSPGALAAVEVAAAEAARRHRPLRLIHVVTRPVRPVTTAPVPETEADDPRRLVEAAAELARSRQPGLPTDVQVVDGAPAIALLSASTAAALLVVGSRGQGGFAGLLLGATSGQVATHARCPVLVVRGTPPPDAPVLLAIDALHPAGETIRFAFEEAVLRDVPLRALYGWISVRTHPRADPMRPMVDDFAAGELEAQRTLAEALAGWCAECPDVKVFNDVEHTLDPARTLVEASASAGLVVVGSHRRSDLHGMLLGSAAYALVHRAACPVAVVHPDDPHRD